MASPELRALVMRLIAAGSWHEAESAAIQDTSDDSSVSVLLGLAIAAGTLVSVPPVQTPTTQPASGN